jgi:hypothetical protein
LLCLAESREHHLKDPTMREVAETSNQDIKRAEGRQFAVLFDKRFNGDIDEISGIIHDLDHLANSFQSDMTNLLDIPINFEMVANSGMIFVESAWRNCLTSIK